MSGLTRQGVRNLDGKPKNGRSRPATVGCFHAWRHAQDCVACVHRYALLGHSQCEELCGKCGVRR